MSASSVILRGYAGGTIVTRGYSLGEAPSPQAGVDTFGGDYRRRQSERRKRLRLGADLREMYFPKPQTQPLVTDKNVTEVKQAAVTLPFANILPFSRPFPAPPVIAEQGDLAAEEMAIIVLMLL